MAISAQPMASSQPSTGGLGRAQHQHRQQEQRGEAPQWVEQRDGLGQRTGLEAGEEWVPG